MTRPILQLARQHSSTATNYNMEKSQKPKFRRSSSAADDEHSPPSELPSTSGKDIFYSKPSSSIVDYDSGTEEIEQQLEQCFSPTPDGCQDQSPQITTGCSNIDEGFSEYEIVENTKISDIEKDLDLAKKLLDEAKKDFCPSTIEAFHGEFARLISVPLSIHYGVRYYLFAEQELSEVFYMNLPDRPFLKLDNAKAQYKCTNIYCQHAWTSARSRIAFTVHAPNPGFIKLEIFGQDCLRCGTYVDAVWYIDEVCRVMKNLAKFVFQTFFPDMVNYVDVKTRVPPADIDKSSNHQRHDPYQRKGNMHARHAREHCAACRRGLCYI